MDGHVGEFMASSCLGNHGDTLGRQPPSPKVNSMKHTGTMAGSERDALTNRAMQEGGGSKETVPDSGGEEVSHIQDLQRVWLPLEMVTSFK